MNIQNAQCGFIECVQKCVNLVKYNVRAFSPLAYMGAAQIHLDSFNTCILAWCKCEVFSVLTEGRMTLSNKITANINIFDVCTAI